MKRKGYTRVPNALITDTRLSVGARLLYCYIASRPPGWKFKAEVIYQILGVCHSTAKGYVNELEALGYITREQQRGEHGRFGSTKFTVVNFSDGGATDGGATDGGEIADIIILNNSNTDLNKTECESGDKSPGHTQDDLKKFFLSKAKEAQSTIGASDDTMIKFASYWMQRTENGRMLWQTKRTFDFAARLKIWVKNEIRPN
jgi:hypothetical protein